MLYESIKDIKEKTGKIDIEVKIIYDRGKVFPLKDFKTGEVKKVKSVIVADVLSEKGDPTITLDLYGSDIDKFKFMDIVKVTNAYSKMFQGQIKLCNAQKVELVERKSE
jgi:hypothetical protein